MNKLKKITFILSMCFISIGIFTNTVRAEYIGDNLINNIEINVSIDQNGTAHVTETWDVEMYDTNEMYRAYFNLNISKIENLTVKDERNDKYEIVDNWDIDTTKEKKINKCGIYIDEQYGETDICWGVAEDGKHVYTINYNITDFVKQKMGYQTINFKFLSSGINPVPKKASVTIQTANKFNEKSVEIEGIGFDGESKIENGKIIFDAPNGLKNTDYMEINIDFNENNFSIENERISEDVYGQGGILEEEKSNRYKILSTIIVIIILIAGIPIYFIKYRKSVDKEIKK